MAKAFGFTPEQVDNISTTLIDSFMIMYGEWIKLEDRKQANMIKSLFGGR